MKLIFFFNMLFMNEYNTMRSFQNFLLFLIKYYIFIYFWMNDYNTMHSLFMPTQHKRSSWLIMAKFRIYW